MPLKIKTEEDIKRERERFFQGCKRVVRSPACIFLEGNRFSRKAKLLSLPFYAYAGIEKGKYDRFMYEEHERGEQDAYYTKKLRIKERLPQEEKSMFRSETPISSIKDDRFLNYQIYLNEEVKRFLLGKQELEKAIKSGRIYEAIKDEKGIDFKDKESNFKDYFKIWVWSEIPSHIGLNEGAAIAAAVAFLLVLELLPNESRAKSLENFFDLKMNRPEEIVVDWLSMEIFTKALQLDFFSNGAAVFASIMGNKQKQEAIDYECLFHEKIKKFFEPHPEISCKNFKDMKSHMQAFEKVTKVKGINAYFDECGELSKKTHETIALFKWDYSRLALKSKQGIALSVMDRSYISGEKKDFKLPLNAEVELHLLSPAAFAVIGEPSVIALGEKRPEKYIFGKEKDDVYSKYSVLYSSRTQGWEVEGVNLAEFKKSEKIREIESVKPIEEKAEYEIWENKKGWRPATSEDIKSIKKNKTVKLLLDESGRIYIKGKDRTNFFKRKRISYPLLKYFLENKGSTSLNDVFEQLRKTKGCQTLAKRTINRSIRSLNLYLKKMNVKKGIFFIGKERAYIPSEVKIGFIRKRPIIKIEDYLQ